MIPINIFLNHVRHYICLNVQFVKNPAPKNNFKYINYTNLRLAHLRFLCKRRSTKKIHSGEKWKYFFIPFKKWNIIKMNEYYSVLTLISLGIVSHCRPSPQTREHIIIKYMIICMFFECASRYMRFITIYQTDEKQTEENILRGTIFSVSIKIVSCFVLSDILLYSRKSSSS